MSDLETSILEKKQERVKQLLKKIMTYSDISIPDIVLYLGYKKAQYSSFNKFAQGKRFPKFLNAKIDIVLENLELGAKNTDTIRAFVESLTEDGKRSYKRAPRSPLVWIPYDREFSVIDYNGTKLPISFIQMESRKGIVTHRNTSIYDADGEIYVDHIGMSTGIEPGTRIAIKRINKTDWQTDRYYVIIDESDQISIRELLPGDDEKTIRYVSQNIPEGPHMVLPLDRIAAIFSIVDGNYIPKPKRNGEFPSPYQQ